MMASVKSIYEADPSALNSVIESMEWVEDLKLDKKDITLINKFLSLFQPIQKMSDQLGGEKYSSIHMVLPIVKDIKDNIDSYKSDKLKLLARSLTNTSGIFCGVYCSSL